MPEGIKRDAEVRPEEEIAPQAARRIEIKILPQARCPAAGSLEAAREIR